MKETQPKAFWGGSAFSSQVLQELRQEAGVGNKTERKAALWLAFLQLAQWLSHLTQDSLPKDGPAFNGLSKKTPPDMPVGQSAGGNSSAETPFPQETLMCVKLTFNPAIRAETQLLVQYDTYFQVYYVILATYSFRQDVHPLLITLMYHWKRVWWSWWNDVPVVTTVDPGG